MAKPKDEGKLEDGMHWQLVKDGKVFMSGYYDAGAPDGSYTRQETRLHHAITLAALGTMYGTEGK